MERSKLSDRFMAAIIAVGTICVLAAAITADYGRADIFLVLLAVFTIVVGSRVTIPIPRFKSHVSVSDTFIFLTFLVYGGEFALILAAAEAAASSWRFCNRKLTVLFNAATMAVSTGAIGLVLRGSGLYTDPILRGNSEVRQEFVIALSLIALTQFLVNTSFASVHDVLRHRVTLWETWKTKYIWTFFSYFIGAASAGIMIQISGKLGLGVILAIFPVIFFVFLSYRMYMKNLEISVKQAEQAEQSAKILEEQSEALRESEERFRIAFDYAPIGIGLVSPTGTWLKVNRALVEILGYSESEFHATDFQSLTISDDLGGSLTKVNELLAGKIDNHQMEQRYLHKSGRTVWTLWSASAAADARSKQPNLIFQIQDITGRKIAEEKLQHEANHDVLTGLPNRAFFMKRLDVALERSRQIKDQKVSVLFIDLDRFKNVNDSLGHLIGDELLKEIAVRLQDCMRPSDIVARLGGDEFTILVEGKYDAREVTRIADRIQKKFTMPFDLSGHEVFSSASIGILHASEAHLESEDVMRDADTAMYQAKRAGKARHEVFDEKMHRAVKETLKLETDLRRAFVRDEIRVFYQPIYSLESNDIECFESFARWDHPELGLVSPNKFIPLAEEIGLIDKLCEKVLTTACTDIGLLNRRVDRDFGVSVNLSCKQFSQFSLVQDIERTLAETSFSPKNLKLEITESVFFEHHDRAVVMLDQLRASGVEIDIDDFGTGYSNLGYLKKLPISAIKLDRSFVSMIDSSGGNDEIVKAILTLASNLGLSVVAEGVETDRQLARLRELKCDSVQGFLFTPPLDFDSLCDFLEVEHNIAFPRNRISDVSSSLLVQ